MVRARRREEKMMTEWWHFLDGKKVEGRSARFGDVFDPSAGTVAHRVPLASAEETGDAIVVAAAAQPEWAAVNPQRRARVLLRFLELVEGEMDSLARPPMSSWPVRVGSGRSPSTGRDRSMP
jgi:malonate-semialdehyde dehydrogenase (acetylating) / methylmalonate-semialdehyde dehydrogenase